MTISSTLTVRLPDAPPRPAPAARAIPSRPVQDIADGARVRRFCGQGAVYRRLTDGSHEITVRGRAYIGRTIDQAIKRAREGSR